MCLSPLNLCAPPHSPCLPLQLSEDIIAVHDAYCAWKTEAFPAGRAAQHAELATALSASFAASAGRLPMRGATPAASRIPRFPGAGPCDTVTLDDDLRAHICKLQDTMRQLWLTYSELSSAAPPQKQASVQQSDAAGGALPAAGLSFWPCLRTGTDATYAPGCVYRA